MDSTALDILQALTVTLTTVIMSLITLTQDTQVRAVHKSRFKSDSFIESPKSRDSNL